MSRNPVRKVMAMVITLVFALVLGAVIGPVSILIWIADPMRGWALDEWMKLYLYRVYRALAFAAPPREHTPG